mgnify:CR=1 FL=1
MAVSTENPDSRSLDDVLDGLRFAMVSTNAPTSDGLARPLTLLEHDAPLLRFLPGKVHRYRNCDLLAVGQIIRETVGRPSPIRRAISPA